MTATTPSNPQPGSDLGTLRNQAGHCPTCSPIPRSGPNTLVDVERPGKLSGPRRRRAVDEPLPPSSTSHPRRASARRRSPTTLDERSGVSSSTSSRRASTLVGVGPSTSASALVDEQPTSPYHPRRRVAPATSTSATTLDERPDVPSTSAERLQRPQRPCADEPPAFLVADEPPRRAPPSSATPSNRRAPPPSSTSRFSATQPPGSDNGESPSGALLRGFTWVRRQATKPDTSAGQAAVSAIPDPKPVSGGANSPTVAAGVLCSADQIVPPQSLRTAATVSDIELHGADPVRSQSRAQQ